MIGVTLPDFLRHFMPRKPSTAQAWPVCICNQDCHPGAVHAIAGSQGVPCNFEAAAISWSFKLTHSTRRAYEFPGFGSGHKDLLMLGYSPLERSQPPSALSELFLEDMRTALAMSRPSALVKPQLECQSSATPICCRVCAPLAGCTQFSLSSLDEVIACLASQAFMSACRRATS